MLASPSALSLLVATAALDPSCGCGCSTASSSSSRHGRRARNGLPGPTSARRSSCCANALGDGGRYRELLAAGRRKVGPEDGLPLHLVACDELAFYLTAEDRKQRAAFAELLRDLVARGRAAGVIVCAATQKPATDVVPSALRDLFGFRLALRCNTPQASDTILGQGWARPATARRRSRRGQRGVGSC